MIRNVISMVVAVSALAACGGRLTDRIAQTHKVKATDCWQGGQRTVFDFDGYDAWVVEPPEGKVPAQGMPWTWTMQWRDSFVARTGVPQMLAKGWHHVSIDTFTNRMDDAGLTVSRRFHEYLVRDLGFAQKACLVGMSWGGFFSVRYAASNPQGVAKIYLDCPFLNLGGACRDVDLGPWKGIESESWIDDPRMPVNMAAKIAAAKIPVLLAYGGADTVLDPKLNSEVFIPRFRAAGGDLTVVYRKLYGHHPHGFEPGETVVPDFFDDRKTEEGK